MSSWTRDKACKIGDAWADSHEKKFTQAKLEKTFQKMKWMLLHRTGVLTRGALNFLRRAGSGLACASEPLAWGLLVSRNMGKNT